MVAEHYETCSKIRRTAVMSFKLYFEWNKKRWMKKKIQLVFNKSVLHPKIVFAKPQSNTVFVSVALGSFESKTQVTNFCPVVFAIARHISSEIILKYLIKRRTFLENCLCHINLFKTFNFFLLINSLLTLRLRGFFKYFVKHR